jgi:hypothetical protein
MPPPLLSPMLGDSHPRSIPMHANLSEWLLENLVGIGRESRLSEETILVFAQELYAHLFEFVSALRKTKCTLIYQVLGDQWMNENGQVGDSLPFRRLIKKNLLLQDLKRKTLHNKK